MPDSIKTILASAGVLKHVIPPRGVAGTVKKKLGFPLTSSKPNDGARRYRIEPRRAR